MATSFLSTTATYNPGEELDHAAAVVDQSVSLDRNYVDLSDLLQVSKHNCPTSSGLVDFDYPSLSDPQIGLSSINELGHVHRVPLPAELNEQFEHMQCNCMMGIMTEISRAWLSIDSRIFVWNYEDGSDLAYFDGLSENVVAAGLVKPRPGIFQPHITGLLCLATPIDVVLLGVSFSRPHQFTGESSSEHGEMHLLPEPLFSIPTDNIQIMNIKGSANGRIFMAGKDGCLYEMLYQAEDGWFSRKCRKVNHTTSKLSYIVPSFLNFSLTEDDPLVQMSIDNSRHILYTRSERGTITVYDLGDKGQTTALVASICLKTLVQNALLVAKCIDRSVVQPLVHIAAIESSESTNIHLVAISHTGIRLYFATHAFQHPAARPCMLSLVHVRMPPGFSANASLLRPSKVHAAHYSKGTLVLAAAGLSEDDDVMWTISPDAFPFQRQLRETQETTALSGQAWAIEEIPSPGGDSTMGCGLPGRPQPPLVVTQHLDADRKFVILNSQGSYIVSKLRPVDQLQQLLMLGPDSDEVDAFFKLHKEQACATCLILATRRSGGIHQNIKELATRAFFLYGGEPEYNYNAQPASIGPTLGASSSYLSPASPASPAMFSTPYTGIEPARLTFSHTSGAAGNPGADVIFSAKHNGLCLYLARLLRPMWEPALVAEVPVATPQGHAVYLSCRWTSEEIGFVLNRLLALKEFMEKNSQFTSPLAAETYAAAQRGQRGQRGDMGMDDQTRRKYQVIAERQETVSLSHLQQLVSRTCESLALLNILTDHQFHVIADALSKDHQNGLRHMNLRNFVVLGKEISSALITSLINMYMDDHAATDAISQRLRELAPSLYSAEDALCSKGSEKLQLAKLAKANPAERDMHLAEALKLFKEIAVNLDLPQVCNQFAPVRFYRGIVDLTLTAAAKRDPQELALHYYRNGEPAEDVTGRAAFSERQDCYKCITECLQYLLSVSQSHPQAPSVPRSPGPPPPADPDALSNTDAARYADEVLEVSLRSGDELVHVAVYEWLLRQGLWERLLDVKSPFLEPYLQHSAQLRPNDIQLFDLLWKYYEKQRNFSAAAKILTKLAERHSDSVNLCQRVEYLSRATMCAKSVVGGGGELLHELEEKMEVARLQQQIHEALPAGQVEVRARLNDDLLDITVLYEEFADRFSLCECKLAIIHCAGHYDPTLVESLWASVIHSELHVSESRDIKTRMRTLKDKVVSLGRVYAAASEKYFPLAYLIKFLEQISCELEFADSNGSNLRFVFTSMQEIGIILPRLLEIYDRLYKSKDPCWKNLRRPYHILHVIHQLLDTFATSPAVVPQYERRSFSNQCKDYVAHYLVDLHTESSTNQEVKNLIKNFKELQAKLERM